MKRILSILLAAMMVVSLAVMLVPVSAADAAEVPNDYSFKFEDVDARNQTADQVIDLGAIGEIKGDIVIDGVIDEAYSGPHTLKKTTGTSGGTGGGPDAIEAYFAVKGGKLYVAVDTGLDARVYFRPMPGLWADENSGSGYSRIQVSQKSSGSIVEKDSLYAHKDVKLNSYEPSSDGVQYMWVDDYLVDFDGDGVRANNIVWAAGVYEMAFDIGAFYKLYASLMPDFSWDNPCMSFMVYLLNEKGTLVTKNSLYAISPADCKDKFFNGSGVSTLQIGSSPVTDFLGYTIIIPETTLEYVKENYRGTIGELGADWRNAIEGQLARLDDYATKAPELDGVVSANEYTTTHKITGYNLVDTYGDITANYSVVDDYFYASFTYAEDTHSDLLFEPYLMVNASGNHIKSKTSATLKTDGTFVKNDGAAVRAGDVKNFVDKFFGSADAKATCAVVASATSHTAGVTTYEVKVDLTMLIKTFIDMGWDAAEGNCIKFNLAPGADDANSLNYALTSTEMNSVAYHTGSRTNKTHQTIAYVLPTVALPDDCTASVYHEHKFVATEYSDLVHKLECTECDLVDYAPHNWDDGEVVYPTEETDLVKKVYTCADCGATKEEELLVIVPPVTDAPVTDAPVTDAPVTDAPVTDAPVTDAPVTNAPVTNAPVTNAPATNAPATNAPATTAAEEKGCGGMIGLSALAIVPMLGAAVVFGKKRED